MTEDNIVYIQQGRYVDKKWMRLSIDFCWRHPLQEQVVDTFVPNDTLIRGGVGVLASCIDIGVGAEDPDLKEAKSVVILTGANACGKVPPFLILSESCFLTGSRASIWNRFVYIQWFYSSNWSGDPLDRTDTIYGTGIFLETPTVALILTSHHRSGGSYILYTV